MNRTNIEWVKNPDGTQGYTWNPITGCLNHVSGLCKGGGFPCYAYKLAHGRLKPLYLNNLNVGECPDREIEILAQDQHPFYPRFWEERLVELQRGIDDSDYQRYIRQSPKGIFVCDMGDLFGVGIPERWTAEILDTIADDSNSAHRFYLLTKQPQNLPQFSPFPDNAWVGVTITNQQMAEQALKFLAQIKASIKFLSCEPLLSKIDLADAAGCGYYCDPGQGIEGHHDHAFFTPGIYSGIDWLIIGTCTGTKKDMENLARTNNPFLTEMPWGKKWTAQPCIEWVREIVEAADRAGVKVFLKENLTPLLSGHPEFWDEIPQGDHPNYESIAVLRQELPE